MRWWVLRLELFRSTVIYFIPDKIVLRVFLIWMLWRFRVLVCRVNLSCFDMYQNKPLLNVLILFTISGSAVGWWWGNGFGWNVYNSSWIWVATNWCLVFGYRYSCYVAHRFTKYQGIDIYLHYSLDNEYLTWDLIEYH